MHVPFGAHVRIETSMYQGATITPYYDSMILKLIVWGQTRLEAIKRMRGALEELIIEGVHTNIEFHYLVLHQKEFIEGRYTTEYASAFIKELNTVEEFIRTT
jgi:acetyl-CoA carboxylase biotin carboxylase subunit